MAKVRKPVFSEAASGKMDEETVLVERYGKTHRRRYVVPKQPGTRAQKETYARMAWAVRLWQRWLKESEREAWRAFAKTQKKLDRFSGQATRASGHMHFIRSAIQCRRAGFEPQRLPPMDPNPQPVLFELTPVGKGLLVRWDPEDAGVLLKPSQGRSSTLEPKLELCLAVTDAWKRPWESLYTTLAFVPLTKGRYRYAPVRKGKRYSFSSRVIAPDGQTSLPVRISLILE